MAERRFYEFNLGAEWRVSFEESAWQIEEQVKPTYERVLAERCIPPTAEDRANLCTLLAFQFLRTKAQRDRFVEMEEILSRKVEAMGGKMEQIEGWEPLTEDRLKHQHIRNTLEWLPECAEIMAHKVLLLAEAAPGTHFYIGDNPVVLTNKRDFGPYGNLGLSVPGIEIYLPLSADLLLCAWCPSILAEIEKKHKEGMDLAGSILIQDLMSGRINGGGMKAGMEAMRERDGSRYLFQRISAGLPIDSDEQNMMYYNSLQCMFAKRHVIDKAGDFTMAKRVAEDMKTGKTKGPRIRS